MLQASRFFSLLQLATSSSANTLALTEQVAFAAGPASPVELALQRSHGCPSQRIYGLPVRPPTSSRFAFFDAVKGTEAVDKQDAEEPYLHHPRHTAARG